MRKFEKLAYMEKFLKGVFVWMKIPYLDAEHKIGFRTVDALPYFLSENK
jgi:hypothetical protein